MFLPNIINSQTVWELWPAQNFGFKGHNYIMKSELSFLQMKCLFEAFYFKGDKYVMQKVRVLLQETRLLVLIYASTKYHQNISNN